MKNIPLFIAWRYVWAKKSMNAIHMIMWSSIFSAVVGVVSLFMILSIYNGMGESTYKQFQLICPDIELSAASGLSRVQFDQPQEQLMQIEGVSQVGTVLEQEVLMEVRDRKVLIRLIGVDTFFKHIINLEDYIIKRNWNVGVEELPLLTVSTRAANQLIIDPDQIQTPILLSTIRSDALISSNMMSQVSNDFATSYTAYYEVGVEVGSLPVVYTNIDFVRRLTHTPADLYSSLLVKVDEEMDIENLKSYLMKRFPDIIAKNRHEQNETYYTIFNSEKKILLLVIFFMLIIAMTGSIGTLRVLFLEKITNAKVLYSLGLSFDDILRKFFYQSFIINTLGLIIGLFLGGFIMLSQHLFGWIKITTSTFSIPYAVSISWQDIIMIILTVGVLNILGVLLAMKGVRNKIVRSTLQRF